MTYMHLTVREILSKPVVLNEWSTDKWHPITWKSGRKTRPWASPQAYRVRNCGRGAQQAVFALEPALLVMLTHVQDPLLSSLAHSSTLPEQHVMIIKQHVPSKEELKLSSVSHANNYT